MKKLLLTSDEQNIIVFTFLTRLPYKLRLLTSAVLIVTGFVIQFIMYFEFPGILCVLAGNLLLLTKGYDNRVNLGKYRADSSWEKVSQDKFAELRELDRKMQKWDLDALDISNSLGLVFFVLIIGSLGAAIWYGGIFNNPAIRMLAINAGVLLLPHWVTGIRSILTRPELMMKMSLFESVLEKSGQALKEATVEYFMLLSEQKDTKLPKDVKVRISFNGQDKDFLGYYGQIVLNKVKGHSYPYFYVVLVAKKRFGLKRYCDSFTPQNKQVKEYDRQKSVEVFIIRQKTTKTSGYHTSPGAAAALFAQGLRVAEDASRKQ